VSAKTGKEKSDFEFALGTYGSLPLDKLQDMLLKLQDEKTALAKQNLATTSAPPAPQVPSTDPELRARVNELTVKMEVQNLELRGKVNNLEAREGLRGDRRLRVFAQDMPASSGKHTYASGTINAMYGSTCIVCGSTENVTKAHIVASNITADYSAFGRPVYRDDLNAKSVRNFLPLCGVKGTNGSCHREFDTYKMAILYDPTKSSYVCYCLDPTFPKYKVVHGKPLKVHKNHRPYTRLLTWRTIKCCNEYPDLLSSEELQKLVVGTDLSDTTSTARPGDSASTNSSSSGI